MARKISNPAKRKRLSLDKIKEYRELVKRAYRKSKKEELLISNSNGNVYWEYLSIDIEVRTNHYLCEGTLFNFMVDDSKTTFEVNTINIIEEYIRKCEELNIDRIDPINKEIDIIKKISLENWVASTNHSTPQWASYLKVPTNNALLKKLTCSVQTSSVYYRFGFKFLRNNGKVFGDGSIQSLDNNYVLHLGKNFTSNELFLTTYNNGIRQRPDRFLNILPKENQYFVEVLFDDEGFLYFIVNNQHIHKILINKEIRKNVYMMAWGDGNEFELLIDSIQVELEVE